MAVLILNEVVVSDAFRSERGFFELTKHHLRGMKIVEIKCTDWAAIRGAIALIPDGGIKFLFIRGHGRPEGIKMRGDSKDAGVFIYQPRVCADFATLPPKMAPNSFIVLESCSTGKFEYDGGRINFANVAMEFAKLTCDAPGVRVIAPRGGSFGCGIFPAGDGWKFMIPGRDDDEAAVCYGSAVKKHIAAPTPAHVAADTAPLIYDSAAIDFICGALASRKSGWRVGNLIMRVFRCPAAHVKSRGIWRNLLDLCPPSQMINRAEITHMNGALPPPGSSLLLLCLMWVAVNPECAAAMWMGDISVWAARSGCSKYVEDVLGKFGASPLAKSLKAARAARPSPQRN